MRTRGYLFPLDVLPSINGQIVFSLPPSCVCVLQHPDSKMMQINLTGFLNGKNAREFMKDLWPLLLSAQDNIAGIPSAFLEQKKEEIRQRQVRVPLIDCMGRTYLSCMSLSYTDRWKKYSCEILSLPL